MCGIVGVLSNNVNNVAEFYEFMSNLLYEAEIRGTDATGFAAMANGKFVTDKLDVDAENFVRLSNDWRSLHGSRSISMIGHTRAATNGSPSDNRNNHPFHGPRYSMIHNGGIWHHKNIAWRNGFDLQTQCDSEVILHFLEGEDTEKASVCKALGELDYSGWFAVSFMNRENGNINLFREKHSPCELIRIPRWNALVFASTLDIILSAMEPIFGSKYAAKSYCKRIFEQTEIPEDSHVRLRLDSNSVDFEDLYGEITYNMNYHKSTSTVVSSADTSAFSGGQSTWQSKAATQDKCIECLDYIEDIPGAMHEIGGSFMCDKCFKGETDFGVAPVKSSLSEIENQEDKDIIEIICKIAPLEFQSAYGQNLQTIFDRLLHHREPSEDASLNENDSISYIDFSGQDLQKKLSMWSTVRLSDALNMNEGEYLAYSETISEALSLVAND